MLEKSKKTGLHFLIKATKMLVYEQINESKNIT